MASRAGRSPTGTCRAASRPPRRDLDLARASQRVDRLVRSPLLPEQEREVEVGERHVRTALDQAAKDRPRPPARAGVEQLEAAVDLLIEANQAFRVVLLGVRLAARSRARRVAERTQPLGHVGRFGAALAAGATGPNAFKPDWSTAERSRARSTDWRLSAGSLAMSYSSWSGRSMYFSRPTSTPVSGAQPRLSDAASDSKYDARTSASGSRELDEGRPATDAGRRLPGRPGWSAGCRRAGRGSDDPAGTAAAGAAPEAPPVLRDDQRDAQRGFVGEHAVGRLAVVAEALAVVARHDDERRARRSAARTCRAAAPAPRRRTATSPA